MIETTVVTYKILLDKYTDYKYQLDYVIDGDGTSYDHISWLSKDIAKPSKQELDEKIKQYEKVEYDTYIISKRKYEYPSAEEWMLAFIQKEVDGQDNEWNELIKKRNSIKEKFSK